MQQSKPVNTAEIASIPMNFVLGKERSGTTLLQTMLNAHTKIIAPPESRFIMLLFYRYGKTQKWTPNIIIRLCNDLFREGLFRNFWGIDKEQLQSVLIASKDQLTFALICKIIFHISSPGKNDAAMFFDKNPLYYYFLPELRAIFPEAKYIHLVRDYRANLASHKRVFTVKNGTDIAYRWVKVNKLIEDAKKHSPENYFTLTYESLVNNPEKKIEEVCGFLNLRPDKNMAANHQSGMYSNFYNNNQPRFRKVHEKVFHPIDTAFIDSWKEKISSNELLAVEAVAGKYAETTYGYKIVSTGEKAKIGFIAHFTMNLKYKTIKALYRKALSNFGLYYGIKQYVWRSF